MEGKEVTTVGLVPAVALGNTTFYVYLISYAGNQFYVSRVLRAADQ